MAAINFPSTDGFIGGETHIDWNGVLWTYSIKGGWSRAPADVFAADPNVNVDTPNTNTFLVDSDVLLPSTGKGNTILGSATGRAVTTGAKNTLIGAKAGSGITSSQGNTILGFEAGREANISSVNNVIIGASTAVVATGITTSIVIGALSTPKNIDDSNTIILGYDTVGAGPNTVVIGNNNIATTYLKGEVVLNGAITTFAHTLANLPIPTKAGQIVWVTDGDPTGAGTLGNGVHCSSVLVPEAQWNVIGTNIKVTV